jgi:hypothetical protein
VRVCVCVVGTHIHGVGDGQLSDDEDVTEAVTTAPEVIISYAIHCTIVEIMCSV